MYPYSLFILYIVALSRASQVVLVVKNPPANSGDIGDVVPSLGHEDPLEEGMATHSNILAWIISWTEEPGKLQFMGSQRIGYSWSNLSTAQHFQISASDPNFIASLFHL